MDTLKQKILDVFSQQPMVASFATVTSDGTPWVRYVCIIIDHSDLTIRLSTFANAKKVAHIKNQPEVHITFGFSEKNGAPTPYLQIQGVASFSTEKAERQLVWSKDLEQHFKGIDDPSFGVIKTIPYRIEIWPASGNGETLVWNK